MTDPMRAPYQHLIFPLDVPNWAAAEPIVERLTGRVGFFKIGLELFISAGPEAVKRLQEKTGEQTGIFLDLKLHDIPTTVGRAMAAASRLGVDLITIHAEGGRAMIEAAKASAGSTKVLAITVLTSLDLIDDHGFRNEFREPLNLVLFRARRAVDAGCDGLVCSGAEAAAVRSEIGPGPLIITPGIRPEWSLVPGDDQKRIVTPAKAMADGANLIVVGRPIRDADDPSGAADRVADEIAGALRNERQKASNPKIDFRIS
jgi:orotidine-5'-phosphate decarboxylase